MSCIKKGVEKRAGEEGGRPRAPGRDSPKLLIF